MIRRPPRSTQSRSSAASDVYKRQGDVLPGDGIALARGVHRLAQGDRHVILADVVAVDLAHAGRRGRADGLVGQARVLHCLLYTSDAADDLLCVDLGGRRIIKKKKK